MGKKTDDKPLAAINARMRASTYEKYTAAGSHYRIHPMTGEHLRRDIKYFGLSYVRAAFWLGLSIDGLHKQMRGDRPVSLQTALLWEQIRSNLHVFERLSQVGDRVVDAVAHGADEIKAIEREMRRLGRAESYMLHQTVAARLARMEEILAGFRRKVQERQVVSKPPINKKNKT
jgi:hypothetical protein